MPLRDEVYDYVLNIDSDEDSEPSDVIKAVPEISFSKPILVSADDIFKLKREIDEYINSENEVL